MSMFMLSFIFVVSLLIMKLIQMYFDSVMGCGLLEI